MTLIKGSARKDVRDSLKARLLKQLKPRVLSASGKLGDRPVVVDFEGVKVIDLEPDTHGDVWFKIKLFYEYADCPGAIGTDDEGAVLCSGNWSMVRNKIDLDLRVEKRPTDN